MYIWEEKVNYDWMDASERDKLLYMDKKVYMNPIFVQKET